MFKQNEQIIHSNVQLADGAAYRVPMPPDALAQALQALKPGEFLRVEYGGNDAADWWLNPAAIQRITVL